MSRWGSTPLALIAMLAPVAHLAGCEGPARVAETPRICEPGGTFEMGTAGLDPCARFTEESTICRVDETSERAWHRVYLTPYYLDATEVTNTQYADCVARGPCTKLERDDAGARIEGTWARFYATGSDWAAYPVVQVSHAQAQAYCEWRGGRLPTEAEWEMAARGPEGRASDAWPWGEGPDPASACRADAESIAFGRCAAGFPWPVGTAALDRRQGVRDLLGNVAEWVLDAWDPLAFCADESRALYADAGADGVLAMPTLREPAALDARCAGENDCLSDCDAERFWCLAACHACEARDGEAYAACQHETFCAQSCQQPVGCDCGADADRDPDCEAACRCLPDCRAAGFPPAEAPDTCLRHCFDVSEARCRERGCLAPACRTFCGEVLRESNRLCEVRQSVGGAPVEVPVILTAPPGLEGHYVVKGGDYLVSEAEACALRVGRRSAGQGISSRIGFRCAFDAAPGQRDCNTVAD